MELIDYYKAFQRFWWLIIIATLTMAGAGYYKAVDIDDSFRSTIQLDVGQVQSIAGSEQAGASVYADRIYANDFIDEVIKTHGRKRAVKRGEFRISSEQTWQSRFFVVVVDAKTADIAQSLANTAGRVLITRSARDSLESVKMLNEKVDPVLKEIDVSLRAQRRELFELEGEKTFEAEVRNEALLQARMAAGQTLNTTRTIVKTDTSPAVARKVSGKELDRETKIANIRDEIAGDLGLRNQFTSYINKLAFNNLIQSTDIRLAGKATPGFKIKKDVERATAFAGGIGLIVSLALALLLGARSKSVTKDEEEDS